MGRVDQRCRPDGGKRVVEQRSDCHEEEGQLQQQLASDKALAAQWTAREERVLRLLDVPQYDPANWRREPFNRKQDLGVDQY